MRRDLEVLLLPPPGWVLRGGGVSANIDLDFANSRYFGGGLSAMLSCSRASTGFAGDVADNLISFGNNVLRITNQGLLIEEARTNVVLWNRDLTNAAWTKSNITAAKDQTGADGAATSASSLTATAGNGTALQAITLASSARFQSAYVKRLAGAGTINMTLDNGATWTAIAPTSAWTKLTVPTQTLANPTVGFRIVTSGDAIAVDLVQNEDGTFATSPIATTTVAVTRAADVVSLGTLPLNLMKGLAGSALVAYGLPPAAPAQTLAVLVSASGTDLRPIYLRNDAGVGRSFNGAVTLNTGAVTLGASNKQGLAWSTSGRSLGINNIAIVTDANTIGTIANLCLGGGQSNREIDAYITRLTIWNSRLPDDTLKSLTA